jgi:hypothetical protein
MEKYRKDYELPESVAQWGWQFHHLGIPVKTQMPDEVYLPEFRFYVSGFQTSPFGIEWMRFEDDSTVHPLIRTVPHIAFQVNNLDEELAKHNFSIITPPNCPSKGVRVAMIEHNGAPIELIEFSKQS